MKIKRKFVQEIMNKGHDELRLLWYWIQVGKVMAPYGGMMKKPDIIKGLVERGICKSSAYTYVNKLIKRGILYPKTYDGVVYYILISHKRFAPERLYGKQKIRLDEDKITTYSGFLDELAKKLALKLQRYFHVRKKVKGILRLRNLAEWFGVSRTWWSYHLRNEPKELVWAWKKYCDKNTMKSIISQAHDEGHYLRVVKISPNKYMLGEIEGFRLLRSNDIDPYSGAYS